MTSDLTTAESVAALVAAHPQWLDDGRGAPERPSPSATLIGTGESYAAWLVVSREAADLSSPEGPRRVVVRVPQRVEDLPRPMAEEFAALLAAPEGVGPRPIHLAAPGDRPEEDAAAYMVVEHVQGQVRPPSAWTDEVLAAHARQLARLHEVRFGGHGDVTATERLQPRLSILDGGDAGWQWWSEQHRELTAQRDVARLWPRVRALFVATEPHVARLEEFSLIHGDPAVPNILVSGGVPRYVDWEWAQIGDPARDLGFIGGAVWVEPWYLPLTPGRITRYLDAYVAAGGAGDPASLAARAHAWLVNEVFFVALHLRRQVTRGHAESAYAERAATLLARLDAVLG